jgi:hypothetical protein
MLRAIATAKHVGASQVSILDDIYRSMLIAVRGDLSHLGNKMAGRPHRQYKEVQAEL